ncbi:hypothetical protein [Nonomuraea endophytica]
MRHLACTPNDLIHIEAVNAQVRKMADGGQPPDLPQHRRVQIRRPGS